MEQRYYPFDEKRFQKMAKAWYTRKPAWMWCRIGMAVFFLAGLALMVLAMVFLSGGTPTGLLLAFAAGSIAMAAVWAIGLAVYRLACKNMGAPYEAMRHMFLTTGEAGVQFGYHDRYDRAATASAVVWQIAWANIVQAEFNAGSGLVSVCGRVERVDYEDLAAGRVRTSFTKGQFGDLGVFSFFDCFEQQQVFRQTLQNHDISIKESK